MAYQPKSYKKFVATAATATLVATAVVPAAFAEEATTAAFTDVPGSYESAIDFVVKHGFSNGLTESKYGIDAQIKRGDAAIIIANAAGLNNIDAPSAGFGDVPTRGALAVNSLKAAGVVNGKTATYFGFSDSITRGEAAIMLQRAFELEAGNTEVPFSDVSDRYEEAVAALLAEEVTNGISATQFGTQNPIKRGDFAKFIYALEEYVVLPPAPEPTPGEVVDGHELEVTFGKSSLVGDGADNTQVTLTVVNAKTGEVATDADDLVLEVTSSHGSLASNRVTVQNGVATVKLASEFTQEDLEAKISAKLIETAPNSEWHDEIGNLVASATIDFTAISSEVDETTVPSLLKAESNEADRVTLYFDKVVTPAMYLEVENGEYVVDADGNVVFKETAQLAVFQEGLTQNHTIRGIKAVAGNRHALEVVLDVDDAQDSELTPNAPVTVASAFYDEFGGSLDASVKTFTFTDARDPELTDVEVNSMREITLTFSEPVTTEYAEGTPVITIDGQAVSAVIDGEFNQNGEDLRHKITVKTTDFLKAGTHSVQVSGVEDYAGNVVSNDTLDFDVPANTTTPAATIEVESPEQVRLTWNHEVARFNADNDVNFQYWLPSTDPDADVDGEWVDFPAGVEFLPTTIESGQEYVYELNTDWTQFADELYAANPDLDSTDFDYTNFQVRATIDTDEVTSEINGLENVRQVLSLNYNGSPLNNFDATSPVFNDDIEIVDGGYIVSFDEPVKAPGLDVADTPSVIQGELPEVVVEFRGTDADGNKVVIDGDVIDYAGSASEDTALFVQATEADLQELVDDEGYSSDWTIIIRNVTDDVGNAAATGIQKGFTVAPTPAPAETFAVYTSAHDGVDFESSSIVLDYSSAVQFTGNATNALNLANYTLNGKALPAGSSVALSLDTEQSSAIDLVGKDGDLSIVTITVPEGTLNETDNVINLSKSLTSANGVVISGKTEITEDEAK